MDERLELLAMDLKAGRYTRRRFVQKALELGFAASALPVAFEAAGAGILCFAPLICNESS